MTAILAVLGGIKFGIATPTRAVAIAASMACRRATYNLGASSSCHCPVVVCPRSDRWQYFIGRARVSRAPCPSGAKPRHRQYGVRSSVRIRRGKVDVVIDVGQRSDRNAGKWHGSVLGVAHDLLVAQNAFAEVGIASSRTAAVLNGHACRGSAEDLNVGRRCLSLRIEFVFTTKTPLRCLAISAWCGRHEKMSPFALVACLDQHIIRGPMPRCINLMLALAAVLPNRYGFGHAHLI
jgi:hypothetical protein